MQLSTRGRYAVMALLDLARLQAERDSRPVKLSEIAERQHISLSYLEQLFAQLRRGGMVASVRGPGGGYTLAKAEGDTWLADIVKSVDEPIDVTRCGQRKIGGCMENGKTCNSHDLWVALGNHLEDFMARVSLAMVRECNFNLAPSSAVVGHIRPHVHIS